MDMFTPQLLIWVGLALILLGSLDRWLKKSVQRKDLIAPELSTSRYRLRYQQEYETDDNNKHLQFLSGKGEANHRH